MRMLAAYLITGVSTAIVSASAVSINGRISYAVLNKPAAFYLAGDSTTAAQSNNGGGWGVGFLKTIANGAIGTDLGYNGATTVSFVHGGAWANTIDAVNRAKTHYNPIVTIQFGHNDQKSTSGINITQYAANLQEMATEVLAAGGTPILVTPLSRREFNSSGLVSGDLAPQRLATISAARSMDVSYIDLNFASAQYLDSIGSTDAATYNRIPTDFTHLNPAGSVVFGNMVSLLLTTTTKEGGYIENYTRPRSDIIEAIGSGDYILPSV